jgi:hypothetical protein
LVVWIAQAGIEAASTPITLLTIPAEGAALSITVYAPTLRAAGDLSGFLTVPAHGESEPIHFDFIADRGGTHELRVRAFQDGVYLGQLVLKVGVEGAATTRATVTKVTLAPAAATSGRVTLQVNRQGDDYSFQLMGSTLYRAVSRPWHPEPLQVVNRLVEQLSSLARRDTAFARPEHVRNKLRALGTELWNDVLPADVRRQFWEQRDHLESLVVMGDLPSVPWELMHAWDDANDLGFIAENLSLTRGLYDVAPTERIRLDSAAYVLPPSNLGDARSELSDVRALLTTWARDLGTVQDFDDLATLLNNPPALLHFACHNEHSDDGSVIKMEGGRVTPADLALYRARRAYLERAPLVFLNACRTAGEITGFSRTTGWADAFMGAGSAAFIGTLWPVRSTAAREYAAAFYRQMTDGIPLGEAVKRARQAIEEDLEDPTWLAYSAYGSPSARLVRDVKPADHERLASDEGIMKGNHAR